ncbi:SURF6-domain-containing protein, partial [Linderina pennispora]
MTTTVPSIDEITASLQKHARVFDDLLGLIPPQFYLPEINEERINQKYMKNTKKDTDAKKKEAARKNKAARLDPDNNKTVQELQAEKLKKKQQQQTDQSEAEMSDVKFDLATEDHTPAEPAEAVTPMPASSSISDLRTRLHERIQLLRQKRKAPEDDVSREALLEKRQKRRKNNKEAKEKAKKTGKTTKEQVLGSKAPVAATPAAAGANPDDVKDNVFFGTLTTGSKKKGKKSMNARKTLEAVEGKKKELDELKKTDAAKAAKLEEKGKWGKALDLAKGERVKDDTKLLRKTIRREEQQKKKSGREWTERKKMVAKNIKDKQQKRDDNIKARVQAKKLKQQGLSKKAIERTLKTTKNGGVQKKKGGKARPGFEGKAGKAGK